MGPTRYARSIWFAISVFFSVLVLRCYQIVTHVSPPRIRADGSIGVRCGMGTIGILFGMFLFGVLAVISLLVFVTREKQK